MINLLMEHKENIIQNQEGGEHVRVGFAINEKQALDIFAHRDTNDVVVQIMDIEQYLDEECLEYSNKPTNLLPKEASGKMLFSNESVGVFQFDNQFELYVFVSFNDVYISNYNESVLKIK